MRAGQTHQVLCRCSHGRGVELGRLGQRPRVWLAEFVGEDSPGEGTGEMTAGRWGGGTCVGKAGLPQGREQWLPGEKNWPTGCLAHSVTGGQIRQGLAPGAPPHHHH